MRAGQDEVLFAQWLLSLGDGRLPLPETAKSEHSIQLPQQCRCDDLITAIFGNTFTPNDTSIHSRAILCPLNEDTRLQNEQVLLRLTGAMHTFKSVDTVEAVEGEDEAALQQLYSTEFLNTVQMNYLPPHELNIKKGAVVMLIRNLCLKRGLCNGTRLLILDAKTKVLQVRSIINQTLHCTTINYRATHLIFIAIVRTQPGSA